MKARISSLPIASRVWLPNLFMWQELGLLPVALGAAAGSYSHVVLDSLMHRDITPFAPFSNANPLLQAVSLRTLHWSCPCRRYVPLMSLPTWLHTEQPRQFCARLYLYLTRGGGVTPSSRPLFRTNAV
jgi:membrane-bound metal-dependent hydrolase YbcI (DUF457 family)